MQLYGKEIDSRLLLGTAQYPSPQVLADAVKASGTQIITVSLRREGADGGGERVLAIDQRAERFYFTQHRWLSHGERGGDHGADGARGFRYQLD